MNASSVDSDATENLEAFFEMIQAARHCVAFTGAGVSTLSGISDFRGKNGLYKTVDAEKIFDIEIFRRDPSYYYEATRDFIYNLDEKRPSVVHRTLAELERRGLLAAIITQNIDLLHQKAGQPARHRSARFSIPPPLPSLRMVDVLREGGTDSPRRLHPPL